MHKRVFADNEFLMSSEVARELGVAKETVLLWERTGKLLAIKATNGFRFFSRAEVERMKHEREAKRA